MIVIVCMKNAPRILSWVRSTANGGITPHPPFQVTTEAEKPSFYY